MGTWILFNICNVCTNLLLLIPQEGDPVYTIVVIGINGIPLGATFLPTSILADVIDYDEFLNGVRSEGTFMVFQGLLPKFMAIPGGAIPVAIIKLLGFREPLEGVAQPQVASVKAFIQTVFVVFPVLCSSIGLWVKWKYFPLRGNKAETMRKTQRISEGIAAHMRGEAAEDPLRLNEPVELLHVEDDEVEDLWILENFGVDSLR